MYLSIPDSVKRIRSHLSDFCDVAINASSIDSLTQGLASFLPHPVIRMAVGGR
jgi:hypothetical protein